VTVELALGCSAALAGGVVQSATGFGFALIAAPGLTAVLGPRVAVSTLTVIGALVNVLTLGSERRTTAILRRRTALLVVASIPGAAVGALLLAHLPVPLLRAIVAAITIAAVAIFWLARNATVAHAGWPRTAWVGALAGTMGAVAGINGPPVVAHLRRLGASAAQARDTLAAFFLASGAMTFAALVATGALKLETKSLVLTAAAAGIGQLVGRFGFHALTEHRDVATLATLVLSAAMAAAVAVQAAVA
jgi:uncharacterized protein